jgi:hypothetical protein
MDVPGRGRSGDGMADSVEADLFFFRAGKLVREFLELG